VVNSFVFVHTCIYIYFFYNFITLICVRGSDRTAQPITFMFEHMVGMDKAHVWYKSCSRLDEVKLTIGQGQIFKWSHITYYWTYRVDTWTSWPMSVNKSPEVIKGHMGSPKVTKCHLLEMLWSIPIWHLKGHPMSPNVSPKITWGHQRSFAGNLVVDPDLTFKRSHKVECSYLLY
jgi:hypothetical protein